MAIIKTVIGKILVKETSKEIFDKFSHQWIELTEITTAEKMNGDTVKYETKFNINKDFIIIIE